MAAVGSDVDDATLEPLPLLGDFDAEVPHRFEPCRKTGYEAHGDVLDDDVPIVEVAPAADARYTARLIMKACDSAPCLASARVFQRR